MTPSKYYHHQIISILFAVVFAILFAFLGSMIGGNVTALQNDQFLYGGLTGYEGVGMLGLVLGSSLGLIASLGIYKKERSRLLVVDVVMGLMAVMAIHFIAGGVAWYGFLLLPILVHCAMLWLESNK